jgi:hypothetical protein
VPTLNSTARGGLALLAVAVGVAATPATPGTPGTPGTAPSPTTAAGGATGGGLRLEVNERGKLSRSIAAVASDGAGGGRLTVRKPAGARVRKAYMAIASAGFTGTPLTDPVTVDGRQVAMMNEVATGIGSYNYLSEITDLVRAKIDKAPAGGVPFVLAEPQPGLADGEIVVVIFDDPAVRTDRTVSLLYGALGPTGDEYQVSLAAPIEKADPVTRLELSLGISDSYQSGGARQDSTVDVDGKRLTGSAGGADDGAPHNGALITVGGDGDSPATATDDELYDLAPFVAVGDRSIAVRVANPSRDDNILLATLTMSPPVTGITTGSGAGVAYVALGDSTTTGFSAPACRQDRVASAYGCVGTPPATPYPDRIAAAGREYADEHRAGIWGYTVHEAVTDANRGNRGNNAAGSWTPQLLQAEHATRLVTVSFGADDMRLADVTYWLTQCTAEQLSATEPSCRDAARKRAEAIRPDVRAMMARLDAAKRNGAAVVVTQYYNPWHSHKDAGPRDCTPLWAIAQIVTGQLNRVLGEEAAKHGFLVVPPAPKLAGHGAGATDSYVFGSDCDVAGVAGSASFDLGWPPSYDISPGSGAFDPHLNDQGAQVQADQILEKLHAAVVR